MEPRGQRRSRRFETLYHNESVHIYPQRCNLSESQILRSERSAQGPKSLNISIRIADLHRIARVCESACWPCLTATSHNATFR